MSYFLYNKLRKRAGITDYAKALWWKLNDKQFLDAANRLQKNTQNIENADEDQLRRDAATLNKLRTNPVTWNHIKNNAYNNSRFKQFVDKSDIISRWANPNNKDIENIKRISKGIKPLNFLTGSVDDNEFTLQATNMLLSEHSPYKNAVPSHYKSLWSIANPMYAGIVRAKRHLTTTNNNLNNKD